LLDCEVINDFTFNMALRVLLADNSETIRKVMQLSLQDYAVEVKTVNSGIDVQEVAKSFRPDIIFADVLLQKHNGYEVAQVIKTSEDTSEIPIVLMWSGFMFLDEDKFKNCGANDRLEKPFDAQAVRELIKRWVPKSAENPLENFVKLPDISFIESELAAKEREKGLSLRAKPEIVDNKSPIAEEPPSTESEIAPSPVMHQTGPVDQTISRPSIKLAPIKGASSPQLPPNPTLEMAGHSSQEPYNETEKTGSNWTMDSFDDIEQFASSDSSSVTGDSNETLLKPDEDEELPELELERFDENNVDDFSHRELINLSSSNTQAPIKAPTPDNDAQLSRRVNSSSEPKPRTEAAPEPKETVNDDISHIDKAYDANREGSDLSQWQSKTLHDFKLPVDKLTESDEFEFVTPKAESRNKERSVVSEDTVSVKLPPRLSVAEQESISSSTQMSDSPEFRNWLRGVIREEIQSVVKDYLDTKIEEALLKLDEDKN